MSDHWLAALTITGTLLAFVAALGVCEQIERRAWRKEIEAKKEKR